MKLAAAAAAALALLAGLVSAGPHGSCTTSLDVHVKAPRTLRNNQLHMLSVTVKNTGTAAANDVTVAVSGLAAVRD